MSKKTASLSAGRPSVKNGQSETLSSLLADQNQTTRVNFDLSIEEHTKLKIYAARQGKTIKALLTDYVKQLPKE